MDFDNIKPPKSNLNELAEYTFMITRMNGFETTTPKSWDNPYLIPQKIALIHSEPSEALEWFRELDKAHSAEPTYLLKDRLYTYNGLRKLFAPITKDLDQIEAYNFYEILKRLPEYNVEDVKREFGFDLVDTIIRIFELAHGLGIDLDILFKEKCEINSGRGQMHDGKKI